MSWLGGPLPGTGETIGLNPAPKFDPSYSDFYDQGGWTETIIGPDMSEEIYRGTVGDDRWSLDFLKDYTGSSDREPTNLDTAKSQYNLPTDRSRGSWYEQISPSVGISIPASIWSLIASWVPFSIIFLSNYCAF